MCNAGTWFAVSQPIYFGYSVGRKALYTRRPFLEKLLLELKQAGLTTSRRGPDGGYSLALPPDQIRIGDIFSAVQGPVNFTEGFEPQELSEVGEFFAEIEAEVIEVLNTKTLHELCCHVRKLNQLSAPTHSHPFSI